MRVSSCSSLSFSVRDGNDWFVFRKMSFLVEDIPMVVVTISDTGARSDLCNNRARKPATAADHPEHLRL